MARHGQFARVSVVLAGLLGIACAGPNIIDLNSRLTQLQYEKSALDLAIASADPAANEVNGVNIIKRTEVDAALEAVANEAKLTAESANDTRARIANYRIAAMADWQRGSDRALTISRQGSDLCNQGDNVALVPRDCTILFEISFLVRNDQVVGMLQGLDREAGMAGFVGKYRGPATELISSYNGIGKVMSQTTAVVSPGMKTVMESQRGTIRTNIIRVANIFAQNATVPPDTTDALAFCGAIARDAPDIVPPACPRGPMPPGQ